MTLSAVAADGRFPSMSAGFGHGQNLNLMPRILALHKLA
jgi:hypothetical protein